MDGRNMALEKTRHGRSARTKRPANTRRIEKVEATRQSLFDAALKVVGENGYAGSSIAKIAARANVAQGTFYSYFASQQDVFDQLLPYLGNLLLNQIREKLKDCKDPYEREAIGFRAYFDFLSENPEFERILSEAAVFTPQGFRDHVRNIVSGYMRAFRHSRARGVLPHYSERELEAVTYMLLGARAYLSQRFMAGGNGRIGGRKLPEWAFTAYMKFLRYGLTGPRRTQKPGPSVSPTEVADIVSAGPPEVLEADAHGSTIRAVYDPGDLDLQTLLARMAMIACRAVSAKVGQMITVSHYSCNVIGPEPSMGSIISAKARFEANGNRSRSITVRYIDGTDDTPVATAQLFAAVDSQN